MPIPSHEENVAVYRSLLAAHQSTMGDPDQHTKRYLWALAKSAATHLGLGYAYRLKTTSSSPEPSYQSAEVIRQAELYDLPVIRRLQGRWEDHSA